MTSNQPEFSTPERTLRYFVLLMAVLTIICVVPPLNPYMPKYDLESSWQLAMNYAVAHHISIGKDFIFTFGPYAGLFDQQYLPKIDALLLVSGGWLSLCFIMLLHRQIWRAPMIGCIFIVVFANFMFARDALFYSYTIIYVVTYVYIEREKSISKLDLLFVLLTSSSLGLLMAVKASYIFLSAGAWIAGLVLLLQNRRWVAACVAFATTPISFLVAWAVAGQPISGLWLFLKKSMLIVAGYTEAMSIQGSLMEVFIYYAAAASIVLSIVMMERIKKYTKSVLVLFFAFFLMIGAKAGFVRHDAHALNAGGMIVVAITCLYAINRESKKISSSFFISSLLSLISLFVIEYDYQNSFSAILLDKPLQTYRNAIEGVEKRLNPQGLREAFDIAMKNIASDASLPKMSGKSDLYMASLSYLFASGNDWQPRPVIQSYQSYGTLMSDDALRLRSASGPQNIFFRFEPIDEQLPMSEIGPSALEMLSRYQVDDLNQDTLILTRKALQSNFKTQSPELLRKVRGRLGYVIDAPSSNGVLFAVFTLKPSVFARVVALAYKAPQFYLDLTFSDDSVRTFRVIPGMIKEGFILSPLLEDVTDFARVYAGDPLPLKAVKRFSLRQDSGLGRSSGEYDVTFYQIPIHPSVSKRVFPNFEVTELPAEKKVCEGSIDSLNGPLTKQKQIHIDAAVNIKGWVAVSTQDGTVAQDVLIVLTDEKKATYRLKAEPVPRDDVVAAFNRASLRESGFAARGAMEGFHGSYMLGVVIKTGNKMYSCSNLSIPVVIN